MAAAEIVLPAPALGETVAFFTDRLGFRLDAIFPADEPNVALLSGHGLSLRLERFASGSAPAIRIRKDSCTEPTSITAPNGTRVDFVPSSPALVLPPLAPSLVVSRQGAADWKLGRAEMRYRDLVPDRQGGRFIASHIEIQKGGPVPDYVHFHEVFFQMIYCHAGWVRVVYEDQGPPFLLAPGDAVLQPPQIRHRVLECAPATEVVEIGCPADHVTRVEHELTLPTPRLDPERDFGGQRFVRHQASTAVYRPWRISGFEARDLGIARATGGLARAEVARKTGTIPEGSHEQGSDFLFVFVLSGELTFSLEGRESERLSPNDSITIPRGLRYGIPRASDDAELLEVALPA